MKTFLTITSGVGIVTLLFAGYVFLRGLPDAARYLRISRMWAIRGGSWSRSPKSV